MITVRVKRVRKNDDEYITYEAEIYSCRLGIQFRSDIRMFPGALEDQIRGKINDHMKIIIGKEEP